MCLTLAYQPFRPPVDLSVVTALFAVEQEQFAPLQGAVMQLCTSSEPPVTEFVMVGNGEHGIQAMTWNPEHVQRHLKKGSFECNTGVAAAWNAGISLSEGRNLIIVNEDCVPTPETMRAMSDALDEHPDWGVVGIEGVTFRWQGEKPVEQPNPSCFIAVEGFGPPRWKPVNAEGQEVSAVNGFIFAARREDLIEVGKISERYSPFWCEDHDICYRMREILGKKTVVIPGVAPHNMGISKRQSPNRAIQFLGGAVRVEEHKVLANWSFHRRWHGAK